MGFGGTKEEMQRLLKEAEKISGIKYDISSYADIVDAIHVVQDEMGITGTTANEAATTIQGSLAMTKASWENLLTGMADDEADFESLIGRFVESVGIAAQNILPRVQVALNGVSDLIKNLIPVLAEQIPAIIEQNVPALAEAAIAIIQALIDGISENQEMLMTTAVDTITFLANSLIEMLPQILQVGFDLIISLAQGIAENLPELIPTIIEVFLKIIEILTDQENLTMLLDAALQIITELGYGLMDAIPQLVSAVVSIVTALADFLIDPANLAMIISAAFQIVVALGTGLVQNAPNLIRSAGELIASLVEKFKSTDWAQIGRDLVAGFRRGIQEAWKNLREWFTSLFGDLKAIAKRILGIASPSKVFKQFGKFVDEGLAIGIRDNADVAYSAVSDLAKGVSSGFDVSLGTNYIGTYKTTSSSGYFNSPISKTDSLLTELISMFRNGTATTNVGNTRELRRVVNA